MSYALSAYAPPNRTPVPAIAFWGLLAGAVAGGAYLGSRWKQHPVFGGLGGGALAVVPGVITGYLVARTACQSAGPACDSFWFG